ncbi:hypothetical protein AB1Y20_006533 [Prymnesium parvum]|uniref:Inositol hexakisphosphate and diphosphoinositol-pentakisphosphate kinase n=1 Tax=Prymnesium parvum TaxID=97485 RepID=A0AB34J0H4_PRYPA
MRLGVCVMKKKLESMVQLLRQLEHDCEILRFDEQLILNAPVESWPICDVLISFHSDGFPLKKAQEYARLRNPVCVNDLDKAEILLDRERVYQTLVEAGVPTPKHAVHDHANPACAEDLVVHDDYLEIKGVRINKPFVEKPVDADDHRIHIYYPDSVGGGVKRLFRKVGDRSSAFSAGESSIRTDGTYIYEEFLPTEGTDVKVYTIGPEYAYAEARKAPTLDGKVARDQKGQELRYPVLLSTLEKEMARTIVLAFGQAVCGFDILRSNGGSFICDVNGWSFVKSSSAYYRDAAAVLRSIALDTTAPKSPSLTDAAATWRSRRPRRAVKSAPLLRAIVGVVRHGDRTPKQKLKMTVRNEQLLDFFLSQGMTSKKEVKLKRPAQLQQVLDIANDLVRTMWEGCAPGSELGSDADTEGVELDKLRQLQQVLRMSPFSGINRKVQARATETENGVPVEALLILKWGGELTDLGRQQAEDFGHSLRNLLSATQDAEAFGTHFHHLHSAYGHEIKFYSSDEGRVQMTAAATAKGFLELEGALGPILVSLVRKDSVASQMLDDSSAVAGVAAAVKQKLHAAMQSDVPGASEELQQLLVPTGAPQLLQAVEGMGNPLDRLRKLEEALKALVVYLRELYVTRGRDQMVYHGETLFMLFVRWRKLERDIYQRKKSSFDISKVPDIYDCVKFDLTHNFAALGEPAPLVAVHEHVHHLAQLVVPLEYGSTLQDMTAIGAGTLHHLLKKFLKDTSLDDRDQLLESEAQETVHKLDPRHISTPYEHLKTRLYFTSESHVYSLFNLLRWAPFALPGVPDLISPEGRKLMDSVAELSYLTRIFFFVYELPASNLSSRRAASFSAEQLPSEAPASRPLHASFAAANAPFSSGHAVSARCGVRIMMSAGEGCSPASRDMQMLQEMLPLDDVRTFFERVIEASFSLASPATSSRQESENGFFHGMGEQSLRENMAEDGEEVPRAPSKESIEKVIFKLETSGDYAPRREGHRSKADGELGFEQPDNSLPGSPLVYRVASVGLKQQAAKTTSVSAAVDLS